MAAGARERRRLANLKFRLAVLGAAGGKQHHLEQNGYASHEEWQRLAGCSEWPFFVLGSRDETAGASCAWRAGTTLHADAGAWRNARQGLVVPNVRFDFWT